MDNSKSFQLGFKKAVEIKDRVILKSLTDLCNAALAKAVETHTFTNRTYNLENSFSYGIYHDGVLISSDSIGKSDGEKQAIEFLNLYQMKKNWGAVIVAGAWYGTLLELFKKDGKKWVPGGGNYIVISDSFDFVVLNNDEFFKKNAIK